MRGMALKPVVERLKQQLVKPLRPVWCCPRAESTGGEREWHVGAPYVDGKRTRGGGEEKREGGQELSSRGGRERTEGHRPKRTEGRSGLPPSPLLPGGGMPEFSTVICVCASTVCSAQV